MNVCPFISNSSKAQALNFQTKTITNPPWPWKPVGHIGDARSKHSWAHGRTKETREHQEQTTKAEKHVTSPPVSRSRRISSQVVATGIGDRQVPWVTSTVSSLLKLIRSRPHRRSHRPWHLHLKCPQESFCGMCSTGMVFHHDSVLLLHL